MLAKFGGVEFHVKKIDYGRGVKIAEASFLADDNKSQVNEPDNIDFKIQGFIYGREVENVKRRLEAALSRKQGLLVMPDGRSAQVKTDEGGWRISGDDENEGYYLLDLNFKKIDADNLSLQIIELKEIDEEKVAAGQAETEKNILAEFDEKFTFEGFPNFVKTQSFDSITSIAGKISKLTADNLIGQIVDPITGNLDILAAAAGGVSNAIMSYLKLGDTFGAEKDYFDTYIGIAGLQSEVDYPEINDESLLQVYTNAKAVQQLVNQEAVVQAVFEASTKKQYDNRKQIEQTVETIQKTAETVLFDTDNIVVQTQISDLVNLGIKLIRKKHAVKIRNVRFNRSFPAVVIAHELYGAENIEDAEARLVKRNEIRHALFCPAGEELEVEDV